MPHFACGCEYPFRRDVPAPEDALSVQSVAVQGALSGQMVRADGFKEGVEPGAVVGVAEVAEFVEDDIVAQLVRKTHEVEVQVDVAFARAAPPVRGVVFVAHGIIFK